MDGNFSAEHMKHRSGERDIALSAGMAFMANPESYKAHLRSGKEMAQVCRHSSFECCWLIVSQPSTCNTYRAIEQANSSRAHLDITGIGATACCHGFFIPTSVVDFQKGEKCVSFVDIPYSGDKSYLHFQADQHGLQYMQSSLLQHGGYPRRTGHV
jgi:Kyakuja-Dileera-Zisupton transposase